MISKCLVVEQLKGEVLVSEIWVKSIKMQVQEGKEEMSASGPVTAGIGRNISIHTLYCE